MSCAVCSQKVLGTALTRGGRTLAGCVACMSEAAAAFALTEIHAAPRLLFRPAVCKILPCALSPVPEGCSRPLQGCVSSSLLLTACLGHALTLLS